MLATIFTTVALAAVGGDDLHSGPKAGDKLPEFKVHGFAGPNEGKEFEAVKATKNGPALIIFVNGITRPAFRFLKAVDEAAAKEEKLATNIIFLDEKEKAEEFLKRAKDSLKLQSPVSISLDGKDGPGTYGLNNAVALTVLLAKEGKVVNNFALSDPNDTAAPRVIAAVNKLIGKKE